MSLNQMTDVVCNYIVNQENNELLNTPAHIKQEVTVDVMREEESNMDYQWDTENRRNQLGLSNATDGREVNQSDKADEGKKKYAPQFTEAEKKILVKVLTIFKNIIEDKKADSDTWKMKDSAWDDIERRFNALNEEHVYRPKLNLKYWYETMKRKVKKKQKLIRQERLAILSGKAQGVPKKLSQLEIEIASLIVKSSNNTESELEPDFTLDDNADNSESEPALREIETDFFLPIEGHKEDETGSNSDWSQYTQIGAVTRNLKRRCKEDSTSLLEPATPLALPVEPGDPYLSSQIFPSPTSRTSQVEAESSIRSSSVNSRRKRNVPDAVDKQPTFSRSKDEVVDLHKKLLQEEHDAKLRLLALQEDHMRKEEERKCKEHNLKMKILQLELGREAEKNAKLLRLTNKK